MKFEIFNQYVTTLAAFIGMGLGVYNFYIARASRQVKLKVIPKSIIKKFYNNQTAEEGIICSVNEFNPVYGTFLIEVVNMGTFPVTIDNLGFKLKGDPGNLTVLQPTVRDNGSWPRKLEPRQAVSLYFPLEFLLNSPKVINIKAAFVQTSCGATCLGTSDALKGLIKFAKSENEIS